MKSRKNTMKRGGSDDFNETNAVTNTVDYISDLWFVEGGMTKQIDTMPVHDQKISINDFGADTWRIIDRKKGGTKRMSRKSKKSKKTKTGRGAYEGGKKKCPKHCRRKTSRTRKGLKHRKN